MHVPCEKCGTTYQMSAGTFEELKGHFICEDCKKIEKLDERLQFEAELKDESLVFELPEIENKVWVDYDTMKVVDPPKDQNISIPVSDMITLQDSSEMVEPEVIHQTDYIKGNRTPKRKGKK